MRPLKILSVIGCRPNIIKIAPLIAEMKRHAHISPFVVHTGQHYDDVMSDIFFRELHLSPPDICLNIGSGSSPHQMSMIMQGMEEILVEMRPDLVLVVGDVNSTVASSLTASALGFPVAHVEAGLRSFDRRMPEEVNRVVTDSISHMLFTTEESAVLNLLKEGKRPEEIFNVGNVMIDTLIMNAAAIERSTILADLCVTSGEYALVTMHRSGNVDDSSALSRICEGMERLQRHTRLVFPLHPRTEARLQRFGCWQRLLSQPRIQVVKPLGYLAFLKLMKEALFVLTDSGGVQEESTFLGVPCLTVRDNTERPVTITHGTNQLVGTETNQIVEKGMEIIGGVKPCGCVPDKWDGHTSERIISVILDNDKRVRSIGSERMREECPYIQAIA